MTYDQIYKAWQAVGADIAGLKWDDFVKALTEQPAQRKPLTPDLEADTGYSRDERAAFTAGWEAAEAAHGSKGDA